MLALITYVPYDLLLGPTFFEKVRLYIRLVFGFYENPTNIAKQTIHLMSEEDCLRHVKLSDEDLEWEVDRTDVVDRLSAAWVFWENENPYTLRGRTLPVDAEERDRMIDKICRDTTLKIMRDIRNRLALIMVDHQAPGT